MLEERLQEFFLLIGDKLAPVNKKWWYESFEDFPEVSLKSKDQSKKAKYVKKKFIKKFKKQEDLKIESLTFNGQTYTNIKGLGTNVEDGSFKGTGVGGKFNV